MKAMSPGSMYHTLCNTSGGFLNLVFIDKSMQLLPAKEAILLVAHRRSYHMHLALQLGIVSTFNMHDLLVLRHGASIERCNL